MTVTNIGLYKYKKGAAKTAKKLLEELEAINLILNLSAKGLELFSHHVQVQEILANLHCNIDLCKIYIENNKKIINSLEEKD